MLFLFGHTCTRIFDDKFQQTVIIICPQRNTAVLRELDSVGQQVVPDLQDAFLICTYKGILVAMYCQSQSFVYGDWHKLRFERMCDCGNPTCGEIRLFLAVVQPEKIQQGVQHFTHAVRRFLNVSDIRPGFIRIAVFPHQSGITRCCRQWCT